TLLTDVGLPALPLIRNLTGVAIGTTHVLLPFMVLPLYAVMSRIDLRLVTAAVSLGASRVTAFRRVYLPMAKIGIISGVTMVFILAIGFYVTPRVLGSPREAMIAQQIGIYTEQIVDFASAGALSAI